MPGRRKDTISSDKVQWMLYEVRVGLEIQKSCLDSSPYQKVYNV